MTWDPRCRRCATWRRTCLPTDRCCVRRALPRRRARVRQALVTPPFPEVASRSMGYKMLGFAHLAGHQVVPAPTDRRREGQTGDRRCRRAGARRRHARGPPGGLTRIGGRARRALWRDFSCARRKDAREDAPGGIRGRSLRRMTDSAPADTPVAIDRVDFLTRVDRDGVDLRLTGRWLSEAAPGAIEPLLVVQVQGRRHPIRRGARRTPAFRGRCSAGHVSHPAVGSIRATRARPRYRVGPPWCRSRCPGVPPPMAPTPSPSQGCRLSDARAWPPDVAAPPADADPEPPL